MPSLDPGLRRNVERPPLTTDQAIKELAYLKAALAAATAELELEKSRNVALQTHEAALCRELEVSRRDLAQLVLERDAALRHCREFAGGKAKAEREAQRVRAELEDAVSQRDAALLCVQKLTLEAGSLAADLKEMEESSARLSGQKKELQRRLEAAVNREEKEAWEPPRFAAASRLAAAENRVPEEKEEVAVAVPHLCDSAAALEFARAGDTDPRFCEETPDEFFSSCQGGSEEPALFLLQKEMRAIEYRLAEEVVELHHSVNLSYLSPEGRGQESCKGYVVCVERNGAARIFAALTGVESGRCWIYAPDRQPEKGTSCGDLMRDALRFAEEVGLLMEAVLPGGSHRQHRETIARCPVLRPASND